MDRMINLDYSAYKDTYIETNHGVSIMPKDIIMTFEETISLLDEVIEGYDELHSIWDRCEAHLEENCTPALTEAA